MARGEVSIKTWVHWLQGKNGGFMFLWCLVYIIFVISFKIRRAYRLPLLDFVVKSQANPLVSPLQALLWVPALIN